MNKGEYKYFTPEELAIANQNGISYHVLLIRRRDKGWSIKKAITEPVKRYKKRFTKEQVEEARLQGLSYEALYGRVYTMGWTYEKAISTPVRKSPG